MGLAWRHVAQRPMGSRFFRSGTGSGLRDYSGLESGGLAGAGGLAGGAGVAGAAGVAAVGGRGGGLGLRKWDSSMGTLTSIFSAWMIWICSVPGESNSMRKGY